MRLRDTFVPLLGVVAALALAGCGANPPAQAEPAAQSGVVLPTAPPMPTDHPQPPTPTPPPAPAAALAPAGAALLADDFAPGSNLNTWSVIDAAYALPGQIRGAHYEDPPLFGAETNPAYGQSLRQAVGPMFALMSKYLGDQWSIGDWEGMVKAAPDELPPHLARRVA